MTHTQEQLEALDEAGRLLGPILQAERIKGRYGYEYPSVHLRDREVSFYQSVGRKANGETVGAHGAGENMRAAFARFLADRGDKLAELAREEAERAEFEAFKAQRRQVAA